MASKTIGINITGKNSAGSAMKGAAKDIKTLLKESNGTVTGINTGFTKAGKTIGDSISHGSKRGVDALNNLSKTSTATGKNISNSMNGAADGMAQLTAGVLGGVGAMEIFNRSMSGAMQLEQNGIQLTAKFGKQAGTLQAQIEKVALVTPGDDTVLKSLLTKGAMSGNITSMQQMTDLAQAYAGYSAGSLAVGKNMGEVQRDLNDYIFTGNTGVLAMDSIYREHLDDLDSAKTVQERINILNKLNKEHYNDLLAKSDSLANTWALTEGYISSALNDLGKDMLPTVKSILKTGIDFNNQTGGWALKIGIVGVAVTGLAAALGPVIWSLKQGLGLITDMGGGLKTAGGRLKDFVMPSTKKVKIDCDQDDDCKVTCGGVSGGKSGKKGSSGSSGGGMAPVPFLRSKLGGIPNTGKPITGAGSILGYAATIPIVMEAGNLVQGGVDWLDRKINGGKLNPQRQTEVDRYNKNNQNTANIKNSLQTGSWQKPIKWPTVDQILSTLLPKPIFGTVKMPTLSNISGWIKEKLPKMAKIAVPTLGSISNWLKSKIPSLKWPGLPSAATIAGWIYSAVNKKAGALTAKVGGGAASGPRGPGTSFISRARGTSGLNYDGLSLNYENYPGLQKNAFTAAGCMSGNCVDMSLGLMSLNNGRGSLVEGTWNGGPHVWYKDPSGRQLDPARKALQNTWRPPARGPSGSGNTIDLRGATIYDGPSFKKVVLDNLDNIIGDNLSL